jgi:hypothetical protein
MKRKHIIVMTAGGFFAFTIILGIYITTIYPILIGLCIAATIGGISYYKEDTD